MSVTSVRPRILQFVVPSSSPSSARSPLEATFHWPRGRWVCWAARVTLCLIAIAIGLAIGGY